MKYLRDEYSALVVQGTCNCDVSRLFRSFRHNTSGLTADAIEGLHNASQVAGCNVHSNTNAKRPRISRTWQQPLVSQPQSWIRQSHGHLPTIWMSNPWATQFPSWGYYPGLRMNHVNATHTPNSLPVNIEQSIDFGVSQTIESWIPWHASSP